jgi:hypothetical protein
VRRSLAALSIAGLLAAGATPALADPRISLHRDGNCFYLWVEAFELPLFCLPS